MITIYTTAPSQYDYGWTQEVVEHWNEAPDGRSIRVVQVPETRAPAQQARYSSGLFFASRDREEAVRLVPNGTDMAAWVRRDERGSERELWSRLHRLKEGGDRTVCGEEVPTLTAERSPRGRCRVCFPDVGGDGDR